MSFRARLFESRLTLTNLTKVTVSLIQRVFTAIPTSGWKATKLKMKPKNNLQESISFGCKIEFNIDANPGLA